MFINDRLAALDAICECYDAFQEAHEPACRSGCDCCCTRNVTLTTLEGFVLAESLDRDHPRLLAQMAATAGALTAPNPRPRVTINHLAEICARGEEPPEEDPADLSGLPCPLLDQRRCPAYSRRPAACRIMVSRAVCRPGGSAEMDPALVSAGSVVMQFIEHLDSRNGLSGNLAEVLSIFVTKKGCHAYRQGLPPAPRPSLVSNLPLRVLMIPPEHRDTLIPLVAELRRIVTALA